MNYNQNEPTIPDTESGTRGDEFQSGTVDFDLSRVNLPNDLDFNAIDGNEHLNNYIDTMGRLRYLQDQLEFQHEWEANQIEEAQTEMENGDRDPYGIHLPFFHFHHNDNRTLTRYNFETWNNNDTTEGDYPPPMNRIRGRMEDALEDNAHKYDNNTIMDRLGVYDSGFADNLSEAIDESRREQDRYDGGYSIWREDYGRRTTQHPNFDFHRDELVEQELLLEDEEGEIPEPQQQILDMGVGGAYESVYGEDSYVRGFRTSEAIMEDYLREIEEHIEIATQSMNNFLSPYQSAITIEENNPQQEEQDDRTGEEDLIALPSRKIRIIKDIPTEARSGEEDLIRI